jgi:hypothetical protein
MPAIDLQRLQKQVSELRELIGFPYDFLRKFHEILVFHNHWALRQSSNNPPRTLLHSYQVPAQVIRQIELGVLPVVEAYPHQGLSLADHLWQDDFIESREFACSILGQLPISASKEVKDRILTWADPDLDRAALDALITKAALRLRTENPEFWETIVLDLLSHPYQNFQNIGLKAIADVIIDKNFTRVPSLFKLVRPYLQSPKDHLRASLADTIAALAHRTPTETLYFLKEILSGTPGEEVEITLRRYATFFQKDLQKNLLNAVKDHEQFRKQSELSKNLK